MNKRKIVKIALLVAAVLFVAIFLIFFRPVVLAGDTLYEPVYTGSMEPAIPVGSVVMIKIVNPDDLKIGDVICFKVSGPESVTHRILSIANGTFITKGDANNGPDIWAVEKQNVIGKVEMTIPLVGYLGYFVRTPIGFAIMIIIPASGLVILELRKSHGKKSRNRIHPEAFKR